MGQFWDGWIASESNDHDAIKVKRVYIDLNDGNLFDGIIFSQIMYWHGRSKETGKPRLTIEREGFLWLAKTYEDWWEECRVNAATARKCIDRIVKRGLLVKRVWKFNGRPLVHLRVNIDIFEHQMNYVMHEKASIRPVVSNRIDTAGQIHLIPQVKSLTETTSETTPKTEKKEIPAPIVADAAETIEPTIVEANTPSLPIGEGKILAFPSAIETTEDTPPRAEFHAVTAAALGITGAAYPIIEKWVNFLTGNTPEYTTPRGKKKPTYNGKFYELQVTPGMSIDEIGAFGRWYRATHPGKTPYTTCEGLNVDTAKFRAAKDHDRYVERFYHDRTDVIIVDDSALPKAAGAEGDAIPISADKRAEAERLMAELLAKMNGNGVKRDSTNRQ